MALLSGAKDHLWRVEEGLQLRKRDYAILPRRDVADGKRQDLMVEGLDGPADAGHLGMLELLSHIILIEVRFDGQSEVTQSFGLSVHAKRVHILVANE